MPLTATQIGFEGSWPLWRESSFVVIGSLRGGLGVGWFGPAGVDIAVDKLSCGDNDGGYISA